MIIFNVNRFFFNIAFFALPKLFLGVIDFFSPSKLFLKYELFLIFQQFIQYFDYFFPTFFVFQFLGAFLNFVDLSCI